MRSLIFIFAGLFFLVGCSSLQQERCQSGDWRQMGELDGRQGLPLYQNQALQAICQGTGAVINEDLYRQGWEIGHKEYCTAAGGYSAGANGLRYTKICTAKEEKEFLNQYAEGQQVWLLKLQHLSAKADLQKERDAIAKDRSVVGDVSKVYHLLSGTSPTAAEEHREQRLADEIYKRESQAPVGALSMHPDLDDDMNSLFASMTGSVFGTILGFGSGHAIQGHYKLDGWKWTAIDSAMIGGFMVLANNCSGNVEIETSSGLNVQQNSRSQGGDNLGGSCGVIAPLWFLGFIGLRAWQSVELWRHTGRRLGPLNNRAYITAYPTANTMRLGAGWDW